MNLKALIFSPNSAILKTAGLFKKYFQFFINILPPDHQNWHAICSRALLWGQHAWETGIAIRDGTLNVTTLNFFFFGEEQSA